MAQSSGIYEISGGGGGPVAARSESVLADWMPIPTSALDCDHASGDMAATCGVVGRDGSRVRRMVSSGCNVALLKRDDY